MEFFTLNNGLLPGAPFEPARGTGAGYGLSEELYRSWNDAVDAEQYDPSCSAPAWQLSFHDTFAPARRVFIAAEDGNVCAFAEASFMEGGPCLLPLEPHWFSGCPILGPQADVFLAHCLGAIIREYDRIPGIMLSAMRPQAEGEETMRRIARGFNRFYDFALYAQPEQRVASLEGGFDGWLSRRSGNFRCKMKKARRRADELGVTFERHIPSGPAEADALYARMLDVESRSWKGAMDSGISETPSREFYHAMIHRLATGPQAGAGRVIFAMHEGRDIGFVFGSLAGGGMSMGAPTGSVYRGQQFSYDQDWREWSIGDLLQLQQIAWLCDEGVIRYDMGMSDDPRMAYKARWAETVRSQQTWLMIPKR